MKFQSLTILALAWKKCFKSLMIDGCSTNQSVFFYKQHLKWQWPTSSFTWQALAVFISPDIASIFCLFFKNFGCGWVLSVLTKNKNTVKTLNIHKCCIITIRQCTVEPRLSGPYLVLTISLYFLNLSHVPEVLRNNREKEIFIILMLCYYNT